MNRKRSHDDLEDADECLPISKRINSLHLEGKVQVICHNQDNQLNRLHINHGHPMSPLSTVGATHHLPFGNRHNSAGDKVHFSPIPTDLNYNIATNSTMPSTLSYSHPHQLLPHIYQGASNNAMVSTDPIMFNINSDIHHSNNIQTFPCDNHHNALGTGQQQNHETLCSFYPLQSAGSFINHEPPMSSCPDVSLVNNHHATTVGDINLHSNAAGTSASNFVPGQLHGPVSEEDIPNGPYDPELGMTENPHYYNNNKLLYEAHLSRLQRIIPDYQLHS